MKQAGFHSDSHILSKSQNDALWQCMTTLLEYYSTTHQFNDLLPLKYQSVFNDLLKILVFFGIFYKMPVWCQNNNFIHYAKHYSSIITRDATFCQQHYWNNRKVKQRAKYVQLATIAMLTMKYINSDDKGQDSPSPMFVLCSHLASIYSNTTDSLL